MQNGIMRPVVEWLTLQQDYLWFLIVLGWATLAVAWWRSARIAGQLPWLPWGALTGILLAGLKLSLSVTRLEIKPFFDPHLPWSLAFGGVPALLACGLVWTFARSRGWAWWISLPAFVLALGAAGSRFFHPITGSWLLAALCLAAALALAWRTSWPARLALLMIGLTPLFAPNSPVTTWFPFVRENLDFNPFDLVTAAGLLLAIIATSVALWRKTRPAADPAEGADLRQLIRSGVLWLAVGIVLAAIMGRWAKNSFEADLLARSRMAAALIDRAFLVAHTGPEFRLDEISPRTDIAGFTYRSHYLAQVSLLPLSRSLSAVQQANPDTTFATITTVRDGHLVFFASSLSIPRSRRLVGVSTVLGPMDEAIQHAWDNPHAEIAGPVRRPYGNYVEAWVPLLADNGRMLGWLTLNVRATHWLRAQVQARLLAFLVVGLGSGLLVANWQQRVRERQREAARREAEAALAAGRLKTAFLAKVSHELRTPIQSLLGYSELLRSRTEGDPKAAGWLASLQQHGELMTRLVNDLIDLGAIDSGSFTLVARAVEPAALVAQTVESFRPRAESRGLSLVCFVDPNLPAWAELDPERFRQVLTNLLGNAIKFTDRGGVTVGLRATGGDRLVLSVRDTGSGIPPAEQSRLFQPFSRLELAAGKEGSGLGLALSSALCRAMGGNLTVESDGATGSTFLATVMAPPATPPADLSPAAEPVSLLGHRVLVVDDNPLVRELFVAFLTEQGATCAAAADGGEALAQARAAPFGTVVLDLALPDGDGTALVEPLRATQPGLQIVGVSAHASPVDRARALAAGMDAFLVKPVSLASLASVLGAEPAAGAAVAPEFRTADALRERLTRQFIHELPARRAEFEAAFAGGDWPRLYALAHYLKSSAFVVRDDGLFDACTGLEHAAVAADREALPRWWARCATQLDRWTGHSSHTPRFSNPTAKPASST